MLATNKPITILHLESRKFLKHSDIHCRIGENKAVKSTDECTYFRDSDFRMGVLYSDLTEVRLDQYSWIQDFLLHSDTQELVILSASACISYHGSKFMLKRTWAASEIGKMKQMYSDHFLVSEDNTRDMKSHALHLVNLAQRRVEARLNFITCEPGRMKSFLHIKPSTHFRLILGCFIKEIFLFGQARSKHI